MRTRLLLSCVFLLLLVSRESSAQGLDPTFGTDGVVVTDIDGTFERATSVLPLPDGNVVVAGGFENTSDAEPHEDFAVVRYSADGSLDPSFGTGGAVTTDLGTTSGSGGKGFDILLGLLAQQDGKLVAVGGSEGDFALVRYNSDGSLDASFGDDGRVVTDISGDYDQVASRSPAVLLPDGRILVVGQAQGAPPAIALVRYGTDGSLDASFGDGGIVTSTAAADPVVESVLLQPDGKVVIVGNDYPDSFIEAHLFVARYDADGALDASFGSEGVVSIATTTFDRVTDAALDPDGRIVIAGFSRPGPSTGENELLLHRFLSDGTLDPAFGTGGVAQNDLGPDFVFGSVALQPDGKVVVGGSSFQGGVALVRANADGSLDADFGTGGLLAIPLDNRGSIEDITLQPDGALLATGMLEKSNPPEPPDADMLTMRLGLGLTVGTENPAVPLTATILDAPYPNPAINHTTLTFTLTRPGHATLTVYDVLGRTVSAVLDGPCPAGRTEATFVPRAPGVYVSQLRVDGVLVGTRLLTFAH